MNRPLTLLSATLVCVSAFSSALAQSPSLQSVLDAKNKQIEDAIVKGDLTPVRSLFSPSATIVNPVGGVVTPQEFSALLQSGTLKYTAIQRSEEKLTLLGNVAVLTYLSSDSGTMQGHTISGDVRRSEVWAQHGHQWQLVSVQSTPVIAQQ